MTFDSQRPTGRKPLSTIDLADKRSFGTGCAFQGGMTTLDYPRAAAGKMDRWRLLFLALAFAGVSGSAGAQGLPRGIPTPKVPTPSSKQQPAIPPAYRPPQGMCRIWINGVPPDQQPAPTDCVTAVRNRPHNGQVIFGDDAPKKGDSKPKKKSGLDLGSLISGR